MKQYLNSEQTAKLIELGFENPKIEVKAEQAGDYAWYNPTYYIGELLSFLPKSIKVNDLFFTLCIHSSSDYWIIEYADIAFGTQARLCKEDLLMLYLPKSYYLKRRE